MSDLRGSFYEDRKPPEPPSPAERRVALVIGNGRYDHAEPLDNPANDAEAMAAVLAKLGFEVVKGIDLNLKALGDVQGAFEDRLRSKPDVALLFYAGHGLQVEGRNYLIPTDAEINQKSHLATRTLLFNDLLDDMAAQASASLIFLDACRDNPFTRNLARSVGDAARFIGVRGGLARIEKVAGTFIAYATAPDQVAYDGKADNSTFTGALLKHIETPGLSVSDMMIDVRNAVLNETGGRQEPWDQSSLRARFYFVPESAEHEEASSNPAVEWGVIQHTTSLAVLAAFTERFPDPPWSSYAEARADELRQADAERQAREERAREEAEAEAAAAEEERRKREEDEAARIAAAEERARAQATSGSSPGEICKAEELANLDFVKDRNDLEPLRRHLTNWPTGTSTKHASDILKKLERRKLTNEITTGIIADATAFCPSKFVAGEPEIIQIIVHAKGKERMAAKAAKLADNAARFATAPQSIGELNDGDEISVALTCSGATIEQQPIAQKWHGSMLTFLTANQERLPSTLSWRSTKHH